MIQLFKHFSLIVLFGLLAVACGDRANSEKDTQTQEDSTKAEEEAPKVKNSATDKEDKEAQTPSGVIYRCDGFLPAVVSEWIQVAYDQEANKINGIWYWNSSDETKIRLKIIESEFSDGEISGYTGKLSFPEDSEEIGFGIIEATFNLSYSDGRFQEFEYEEGN